MKRASAALLAVLLVACATDGGDERDDSFLVDGKADGAIAEGSTTARAVLRLVNEAEQFSLDVDVGLSKRTADNIIAFRAGADGELGSDDDATISTLAQLDGIPYVGPVSLRLLVEYAMDHGYLDAAENSAAACAVLDAELDACLGESAEGCIDIYDEEINACCYEEPNDSALCVSIREHLE